MPNLFQHMGAAIGRAFRGRAPTPEPQPEREERRGLLGRTWGRITGADRRREQEERERQAAERERLERETRERAIAERERQVAERERQLQELRDRLAAKEERTIPRWLAGIPPVMPLGPKGRDGAAYTTVDSDDVMIRLQEAVNLGKRVSLRIHDANGWHDLFLNERAGPGRHKPARGVSAGYLVDQISGDFDAWVEDGCDTDAGGGYEDKLGEPDGYQLTVWS